MSVWSEKHLSQDTEYLPVGLSAQRYTEESRPLEVPFKLTAGSTKKLDM